MMVCFRKQFTVNHCEYFESL